MKINEKVNQLFIVSITVHILIATSTNMFANKETFLDSFGRMTGQWYGASIAFLILSFALFKLVEDDLSYKELKRYLKWVLVTIVASAFMILGSIYPNAIGSYFVLVIPLAITVSFVVSLWHLMIFLSCKIIKIAWKEKRDNL